MSALWIVMPVIDCLDYTLQAVGDCLEQEGLPRILVIDNGSTRETRRALEALQLQSQDRVLCWFHNPPLGGPPSGTVNASWNAGLEFVWAAGGEECLVVNNDVRLHPATYQLLRQIRESTDALFVSAVGVREPEFEAAGPVIDHWQTGFDPAEIGRGGPDFSCFLISKECHRTLGIRFDEQFTYFGDNDYHRRLKLQGLGNRIFSVNVPYLHYGSKTVNRTTEAAEGYRKVFEEHRRRYIGKWGGLPEEEKFELPYNGFYREEHEAR